MKCKLCGKTVRSITHWNREHKAWMRSRPRKARKSRKASGEAVGRRRGKKGKKGKKRHRNGSSPASELPDAPVGFVVETVTYRRA